VKRETEERPHTLVRRSPGVSGRRCKGMKKVQGTKNLKTTRKAVILSVVACRPKL